jgi:undecaprenyl-diphosphatase
VAGSHALVWLVIAIALSVAWRRPYIFLNVAATALITNLVVTALKHATSRDRPPTVVLDPKPLMDIPGSSSFPSGHAATSFACAYVLARAAPRFAWPLFALAALIAFSRSYVGVHYPLDVLAGSLLGIAVAIALRWLLTALPRSRPATPPG